MKYIGVMSGTSLDGIDATLIDVPDENQLPLAVQVLGHDFIEWETSVRQELLALADGTPFPAPSIVRLSQAVSEAYVLVILRLLQQLEINPRDIEAVGMHGQTVWHQPPELDRLGFSWQLGSPSWVANRTRVTTVGDFRLSDLALGGHGAPLAPYAHRLLFYDPSHVVAVLNIGGISNVTLIDPDPSHPPIASDLGPGNMIIDALCAHYSDGRLQMDRGGQIAASGTVDAPLLDTLLRDPFFEKRPPKSTGREHFGTRYLEKFTHLALHDAVTTASWLTVFSITKGIKSLGSPQALYVAGGGAKNPWILGHLQKAFKDIPVQTTEALGIAVDQVETIAFALLARATRHKEAANFPVVTGSQRPAILGTVAEVGPDPVL